MNGNGTSPRIGLLLAHRLIRTEIVALARIRDRAKKSRHLDTQEEAEYAIGVLQRIAERVSTEAKKYGRTSDK